MRRWPGRCATSDPCDDLADCDDLAGKWAGKSAGGPWVHAHWDQRRNEPPGGTGRGRVKTWGEICSNESPPWRPQRWLGRATGPAPVAATGLDLAGPQLALPLGGIGSAGLQARSPAAGGGEGPQAARPGWLGDRRPGSTQAATAPAGLAVLAGHAPRMAQQFALGGVGAGAPAAHNPSGPLAPVDGGVGLGGNLEQ